MEMKYFLPLWLPSRNIEKCILNSGGVENQARNVPEENGRTNRVNNNNELLVYKMNRECDCAPVALDCQSVLYESENTISELVMLFVTDRSHL